MRSLEYPFSCGDILTQKKKIRKQLLADDSYRRKIRIAILGGSTTSEIRNILELFLLDRGFRPEFYESDYQQFYQDVIFGNRELSDFQPELVYIHTTHLNIQQWPAIGSGQPEIDEIVKNIVDDFRQVWDKIQRDFACTIIQNNFDLPPVRSLGNLDNYAIFGRSRLISRLNTVFADAARQVRNLHINDIYFLSAHMGLERWWDDVAYYTYRYALSFDAMPVLAHNIAKIICAVNGRSRKCLILDLDDTLWGGVIGDVGLNGIKIGVGSPEAEAYTNLQRYVLELKNRGVILAVCTKNELETAELGFSHPDSVLRRDDFLVFKANWEPKSKNIVEIAEELNLGLDSLVFLDDNPAERQLVRQDCPEVAVPDIGGNVEDFVRILDYNGYFEPAALQEDDVRRSKYYQDNQKRKQTERNFSDYGAYLASLAMEAEIRGFDSLYLERITQLVNKTNQFNLTARRFNIEEINTFAESDEYITLYGKLRDKFGDNGVTSVIIGEVRGMELHVKLWVMSCRVFKREFEFAMFDVLVEKCRQKSIKRIIGYYSPTDRNKVVSTFYPDLGFKLISEDESTVVWMLDVADGYSMKNRYIKVNP